MPSSLNSRFGFLSISSCKNSVKAKPASSVLVSPNIAPYLAPIPRPASPAAGPPAAKPAPPKANAVAPAVLAEPNATVGFIMLATD